MTISRPRTTPIAYEADSIGNIYVEESDGQIWPTGYRIPRLASSRVTAEEIERHIASSKPTQRDLDEGRAVAERFGLLNE